MENFDNNLCCLQQAIQIIIFLACLTRNYLEQPISSVESKLNLLLLITKAANAGHVGPVQPTTTVP